MSVPLGKTLRTPRSHEPSVSNFYSAEEHAVVGQIQRQAPETKLRQESKTAEVSRVEEELMSGSFEMASQAEIKGTVGGNVKGHQTLERQRLMTPPKIVHPIVEMLDGIRRKWKPVWKSDLMDMNFDDYYEDGPAELYDN
uniref:Uncharacterized protein n=1 Tax=Romanomermis culicivorax TaxID=13658 RepID=A0A915IMN0_ROMCU